MHHHRGTPHHHEPPEQSPSLEALVAGEEQREPQARERHDHREAEEHAECERHGRDPQPGVLGTRRARPKRPDEGPAPQRNEEERRHLRHHLERQIERERGEQQDQRRVLGAAVAQQLQHEAIGGPHEGDDEHGVEQLDSVKAALATAQDSRQDVEQNAHARASRKRTPGGDAGSGPRTAAARPGEWASAEYR